MSMPVGQTCTQMLQSTQSPFGGSHRVDLLRTHAARLAAAPVIGDDQRVGIDHHALEARVGAHVLAHLLAHEAGHAVGGEGIKENPEGLPGSEIEIDQVAGQGMRRREIAGKRKSGPQRHRDPGGVLGCLDPQLAAVHRLLVELDPGVALAFDLLLDPREDFRINGLRAGIAAEQAAADRCEQEQRIGGNDQQDGQVEHILRPEHQAEDVELALDEIEQHGLAVIPGQPAEAVEDRLRDPDQCPPPFGEHALYRADVDLPVALVKGNRRLDGGGIAGCLVHSRAASSGWRELKDRSGGLGERQGRQFIGHCICRAQQPMQQQKRNQYGHAADDVGKDDRRGEDRFGNRERLQVLAKAVHQGAPSRMEKPGGLLTPGCRRTWQQDWPRMGMVQVTANYELATLAIETAGIHFRHHGLWLTVLEPVACQCARKTRADSLLYDL
jgi:hypothetical protein